MIVLVAAQQLCKGSLLAELLVSWLALPACDLLEAGTLVCTAGLLVPPHAMAINCRLARVDEWDVFVEQCFKCYNKLVCVD